MFKKIREHCRRKRIVLNGVLKRLHDFREWKIFGGKVFIYYSLNTAPVAIGLRHMICRVRVAGKIYNFFPFFGAGKIKEALCFKKENSLPPPSPFLNYTGLDNFITKRFID